MRTKVKGVVGFAGGMMGLEPINAASCKGRLNNIKPKNINLCINMKRYLLLKIGTFEYVFNTIKILSILLQLIHFIRFNLHA